MSRSRVFLLSVKGPVCGGFDNFEQILHVVSQISSTKADGVQPRARCTAQVTPQGHGGGDVLQFDASKKQSNHQGNDARSDNEASTDPRTAVDKDKGESAHLVSSL